MPSASRLLAYSVAPLLALLGDLHAQEARPVVNLDLGGRLFLNEIPFDQPFIIKGKLPKNTTRVELSITPPARGAITPFENRLNSQEFAIEVPGLSPLPLQGDYAFSFVLTRQKTKTSTVSKTEATTTAEGQSPALAGGFGSTSVATVFSTPYTSVPAVAVVPQTAVTVDFTNPGAPPPPPPPPIILGVQHQASTPAYPVPYETRVVVPNPTGPPTTSTSVKTTSTSETIEDRITRAGAPILLSGRPSVKLTDHLRQDFGIGFRAEGLEEYGEREFTDVLLVSTTNLHLVPVNGDVSLRAPVNLEVRPFLKRFSFFAGATVTVLKSSEKRKDLLADGFGVGGFGFRDPVGYVGQKTGFFSPKRLRWLEGLRIKFGWFFYKKDRVVTALPTATITKSEATETRVSDTEVQTSGTSTTTTQGSKIEEKVKNRRMVMITFDFSIVNTLGKLAPVFGGK